MVAAESPGRHGWAAGRELLSGSCHPCRDEPGASPHQELPRLPRAPRWVGACLPCPAPRGAAAPLQLCWYWHSAPRRRRHVAPGTGTAAVLPPRPAPVPAAGQEGRGHVLRLHHAGPGWQVGWGGGSAGSSAGHAVPRPACGLPGPAAQHNSPLCKGTGRSDKRGRSTDTATGCQHRAAPLITGWLPSVPVREPARRLPPVPESHSWDRPRPARLIR